MKSSAKQGSPWQEISSRVICPFLHSPLGGASKKIKVQEWVFPPTSGMEVAPQIAPEGIQPSKNGPILEMQAFKFRNSFVVVMAVVENEKTEVIA